jgi:ABC-2 type transport system ATP-binding protein
VSLRPVLTVTELARRYGELEALRELQLEVGEGECVAVIGHNGPGKTTAVRIIAGLLDPSAGSVLIDGARVGAGPDGVIARGALGMVPDTPSLYDDLTVRDHLQLVAIAHGAVDETLDARIDLLLGRLALADKADARPGQLSRGMRQKVQLACALIRPSRLLVLDEPVVGLDPASQRTLRELLLEAKRSGRAVLAAAHGARRGGRISAGLLTRILSTDPSNPASGGDRGAAGRALADLRARHGRRPDRDPRPRGGAPPSAARRRGGGVRDHECRGDGAARGRPPGHARRLTAGVRSCRRRK